MGVYGQAGTPITGSPPACRVFNSAVQSIPTGGTGAALTFDSERFDTDNMHSTSSFTSRITFNTAGLYIVTGYAGFAGSAAGAIRAFQIRLNGVTVLATQLAPVGATHNSQSTVTAGWKFAVNDYVELLLIQDSGGALNSLVSAAQSPEFSAVWVGLGT